jgi:hypothetical protein
MTRQTKPNPDMIKVHQIRTCSKSRKPRHLIRVHQWFDKGAPNKKEATKSKSDQGASRYDEGALNDIIRVLQTQIWSVGHQGHIRTYIIGKHVVPRGEGGVGGGEWTIHSHFYKKKYDSNEKKGDNMAEIRKRGKVNETCKCRQKREVGVYIFNKYCRRK